MPPVMEGVRERERAGRRDKEREGETGRETDRTEIERNKDGGRQIKIWKNENRKG